MSKKVQICYIMPAKIKVIGVRVTPEQQVKLQDHSEKSGVSRSTLIRVAIRRLLEELDKTSPDKVIFKI